MDEAHSPCVSWGSSLAPLIANVIFDDGKRCTAGRHDAIGARPENRFPVKRAKSGGELLADEPGRVCLDGVHEFGGGDGGVCCQKEMPVVEFPVRFEHLASCVATDFPCQFVDAGRHCWGDALVPVFCDENQMEVDTEK